MVDVRWVGLGWNSCCLRLIVFTLNDPTVLLRNRSVFHIYKGAVRLAVFRRLCDAFCCNSRDESSVRPIHLRADSQFHFHAGTACLVPQSIAGCCHLANSKHDDDDDDDDCLVLTNTWQTSSWSITPMAGGSWALLLNNNSGEMVPVTNCSGCK